MTRGKLVESRHRVHAVAVRDGQVVEAAGDPTLVTFLRSAAKPVQVLPLVRERPDLPGEEIAVACASHGANEGELAAVQALLARAEASEEDLECGEQAGSRLNHNCSGKHAAMLLLARTRGWPQERYHLPDHPVQREAARAVSEAAELSEDELETGTDGCGVVSFAMPLVRMAHMFSRLVTGRLTGAERVAAAMLAHPELLVGPAEVDVTVMRARPGAVAKAGAEALLCAGLADGTGVAIKVEDGAWRAVGPAAGLFLAIHELRETQVVNSRGEQVGRIAAEPS